MRSLKSMTSYKKSIELLRSSKTFEQLKELCEQIGFNISLHNEVVNLKGSFIVSDKFQDRRNRELRSIEHSLKNCCSGSEGNYSINEYTVNFEVNKINKKVYLNDI